MMAGCFTSDSKRYVSLDGAGNILLWDVAGQRLERTLSVVGSEWWARIAISPDGKTFALGWMPKGDPELENEAWPDPAELPQPRVTLLDLSGHMPRRELIAPQGYVGGLAFSPNGKTLAFGGAGAVHLFDLTK
jgi:WD40 repeat protein